MTESTRVDRLAEAVRLGVDLPKRIIQVHAVNAAGRVMCSRNLPRDRFMLWCAQLPPGCRVVMEVSSSAHHWARKLQALGLEPRIVAAQLAAPYRSESATGKNDANDAEPGRSQSGGLGTPGEGPGHWPSAHCKGPPSARPAAGPTCASYPSRALSSRPCSACTGFARA